MGEARTPHFYEFGISEPVTMPKNQHYLFLETPGHIKKIQKIHGTFKQIYMSIFWKPELVTFVEKTGTDK